MADARPLVAGVSTANNGALIWTGSTWAPKPAMTAKDKTILDAQNTASVSANELDKGLIEAQRSAAQLNTGPARGMLLDASIAADGGGFWDKLAAGTLGTVARATGLVSGEDVTNYQNVKRIQSQNTRQKITGEVGAQTEGDAARAMLATVSPYKTKAANEAAIAQARSQAWRGKARAPFYTQWANKYGLNGLNEHGQSVEQAFQAEQDTVNPTGGAKRFNPATGKIE